MLDIDPLQLLIIFIITFASVVFAARSTRGLLRRQAIMAWGTGLFFFNGIAGAYYDVPIYYTWYFIGFLLTSLFAFYLITGIKSILTQQITWKMTSMIAHLDSRVLATRIITFYFFLHLMPMLYPEFRLSDLLNPSPPDLRLAIESLRAAGAQADAISKISSYLYILITPFFYIAIYHFRRRTFIIAFLFAALIYIDYVSNSYLSRGEFAVYIGTFLIAIWSLKPNFRKRIIILLVIGLPLFLALSGVYASMRLGKEVVEFSFYDSLLDTIESQTNFASIAAIPVIESGYRANLGGYFTWLITLPLPKFLFGDFEISRIGIEIAEIALGRNYGDYGYYALLAGLVGESVYIFDNGWFWIHAIFLGGLMAFVINILEKLPQTIFLHGYVIMTFSYTMVRGGVNSGLPIIVNSFILFYALIVIALLKGNKQN